MRTESLRRVYCDASDCMETFDVWLPFDVDGIINALESVGAYVEVHDLHTHAPPYRAVGRVLCPACAGES